MICDFFPTYGTKSVNTLANILGERGHEVLVVSTSVGIKGEKLPSASKGQYKLIRVPSIPIFHLPYSITPKAKSHLLKIAHSFQPDIIHSHFIIYWLSLSSSIFKNRETPLIVTLHGLTLPQDVSSWPLQEAFKILYRTKAKDLVESSSHVLCVSKLVEEKFRSLYTDKSISHSVIPIGIDTESLDATVNIPSKKLQEVMNLGGKRVFIYLGRVVKDKGIFDLVRAFEYVRSLRDDVALVIVGDGDALRVLKEVGQNIPDLHIIGFQTDIGSYLSIGNVFVSPSYREGLSTALLEAMYFQLPFVTTMVGGVRDILDYGGFGWIVPKGSVDALAKTLYDICDMSDIDLLEIGQKNKQVVLENFTWNKIVGQLEIFYKKMKDDAT
ncbi:MAG: putative Phosphatidylinositol N-acetylglucosaminyltransferase [Candidatus Thorarchaeota archaeon]|nr:MAG: putative Phosphatidylinositol N-acetylglucosaminyltransferase [Candidatus Thorarchaeota archaeon]